MSSITSTAAEKVYHVSSNGDPEDITTGILSSQMMHRQNPEAYFFMESQDTDLIQFQTENGQVIVCKEDADEFESEQIQSKPWELGV